MSRSTLLPHERGVFFKRGRGHASTVAPSSRSPCCISACFEGLWQFVPVLALGAAPGFGLSSRRSRCQILRAGFDEVWRPSPKLLQFWPQAAQMDASHPYACGRTFNCEKRRDSRRDLAQSPSLSRLPAWPFGAVGQACPEPDSIIILLSEAHLTSPRHLITRPAADLPTLPPHPSTSPCPRIPPCLAAGQQHNPRRSRKMCG